MLDFQTQKRLLDPFLKNPKNYLCADCDSISPTWASLDFGVFLCTNCSGAHRALGPTITRVRSANLDKWQSDWLNNMKIGNSQLNAYWESNPQSNSRKPKSSSDLNDIKRYVYQKYVKKRFVSDCGVADPLTLYKAGKYQNSKPLKGIAESKPVQQTKSLKQAKQQTKNSCLEVSKPKVVTDLLDLDFQCSSPINNQVKTQPKAVLQDKSSAIIPSFEDSKKEQDQKNNFISFDTLINTQKQTHSNPQLSTFNHYSYQTLKAHNPHQPYNPHFGHHNIAYQNNFHHYSHNHGTWVNPHSYNVPNGNATHGLYQVSQANWNFT